MPRYELTLELDITRRIGWSDDDLGEHVDEVFDRLHQASGMALIDCSANLDTGRSNVRLRYDQDDVDDPEYTGRALLGVAIRSCGAGHQGLLPFAEEASMKPERNQWSGLRTPSWSVRSAMVSEVSTLG